MATFQEVCPPDLPADCLTVGIEFLSVTLETTRLHQLTNGGSFKQLQGWTPVCKDELSQIGNT
jgi:hypothetical protein